MLVLLGQVMFPKEELGFIKAVISYEKLGSLKEKLRLPKEQ